MSRATSSRGTVDRIGAGRVAAHRPLIAGAIALVLLYAAAALRYGDQQFLSLAVFLNLLRDNAVLGVVAVGMTFVILSGGIDLSVGAVMSLSSVVVAVLIAEHDCPPLLAMAAAIACGVAFGSMMGAVIHATGLQPFIVTLAGMFLARGLGFLIHLESVGIFNDRFLDIQMLRLPLPGRHALDINTIILLAIVLVGWYIARMTPFGRNVYALGGDAEAARMMGLPVGRTRVAVYALSGGCAALGGVVLTLYMSSGSHIEGVALELDAIAAVVIGGTLLTGGVGSVLGTLMGVLIIGLILTAITTYETGFGSGATRVAIAALLLAFVLLQRALSRPWRPASRPS